MLKISIPDPCHEVWDKMTSVETGRHCTACAKTVVDFTGMNDEEVQYYFLNKKEEKVCGRFKQVQLERIVIKLPHNILTIKMPLWKKFLAACLIVFSTTLFSCDTNLQGKLAITTLTGESILQVADNPDSRLYVGGLSVIYDSIPAAPINCTTTKGLSVTQFVADTTTEILQGDIYIAPIERGDSNNINQEKIVFPDTLKHNEIIMGLPMKTFKKKSLLNSSPQTKNPPKADSTDCNTINSYY